jgi:hypothetical protein
MSLLDIQKLGREIDASDPRDPRQQALIHERIVQLRNELERAQAGDLAAYLDSAAHLTDYLVHMGRMGPEDVVEIIGRLVRKVQEAFELPNLGAIDEPAEARPGGANRVEADRVEADLKASAEDKMLGEVMVQLGYITLKQLDKGLVTQRATDQRIGEALVGTGAATWDQVREAVAVQKRLRDAMPLEIRQHRRTV